MILSSLFHKKTSTDIETVCVQSVRKMLKAIPEHIVFGQDESCPPGDFSVDMEGITAYRLFNSISTDWINASAEQIETAYLIVRRKYDELKMEKQ